MARIRNWGELDYHIQNDFDKEFGDGYLVVFALRLDNPIRFDPEMVRNIVQECEGIDDVYDLALEASYDLDEGNICERGRFCSLFPHKILDALTNRPIPTVLMDIDYIDRAYRGGDKDLYDICITIEVPDMVQNPDKFLKSFARKLNTWLAATKK